MRQALEDVMKVAETRSWPPWKDLPRWIKVKILVCRVLGHKVQSYWDEWAGCSRCGTLWDLRQADENVKHEGTASV